MSYSAEEAFEMILNDSGANVVFEDSSSDEDIEPQPKIGDDSVMDYQIPLESDFDDNDDEQRPSTSAQPPPGKSNQQQASAPPAPKPSSTEQFTPSEKTPTWKASAKRRKGDPAAPEVEGERWNNGEEDDRQPNPLRFLPARKPGPTFDMTAEWSPLSLFQLFFSASAVNTIIDNTNAHAAKKIAAGAKFRWKALDVRDFYIFLAVVLFSGLVHVPHRGDYWRRAWPYNFVFPSEKMSRDRFETILWSLHLSSRKDEEDNESKRNTPNYDCLCKIKPLYTEMVTACKSHFQPYQNICIDERMVASKARTSTKQCIKDKPTNCGYKLLVLADSSTGYTWNFSVHAGNSDKSEASKDHCLSYNTVVDLLQFSLLGRGYTLYVDNFYSSPALFKDLYDKKIACCWTIRKSSDGPQKTEANNFPKKPERKVNRWIRRDSLLCAKGKDTLYEAFSGKTEQRKVKEAGVWRTELVPVPDSVLDDNRNMAGMDLPDALLGYYSVQQKNMKWYKTFFYHFMDIAIFNSFLLYKELCKIRSDCIEYTQKFFREQLAAEMLNFAEGPASKPSAPTPTPTLTCMPCYYGSNASESRRYCRRCQDAGIQRVKTPIYCRKCNVPLCLTSRKNCFMLWHDQQ